MPLPLETPQPDGRTFLNGSVWFVDSDGYRVVFRWHEPLYRVALTDEVHLRLVAVSLRQSGLATQEEICRAFGHSVATQTRWERQYRKHGIDGLVSKKPGGGRRQLDKSQEAFVRRWFHAGCSNREMAKRLGVDEATIRRTLKRLGLARPPVTIPRMLPQIEEQAASENQAAETDRRRDLGPGRRGGNRRNARRHRPAHGHGPDGEDHDVGRRGRVGVVVHLGPRSARPQRRPRLGPAGAAWTTRCRCLPTTRCLPRAGALLAVPLLVRHGLIEAFVKVYGSLHPSFYGLRTIVVTLFLAALLRIKRAEHFKEYLPQDLGAILGLDRAPEVKTVRRKFAQLAAMGRAKLLMDELARQRIAEDQDRVAFLYIDGHVREYHGKFPLFEAKKAQRQVVTPAATDTWVHDADGEPLLVVTSEVNAKLTQVLEPILADVRRLVGDGRRMTVIFDRGGFSPKLFARLIAAGLRRDHLPQGQGQASCPWDGSPCRGKRSTASGENTRSATGRGFAWERCPPRKRGKASGPRHASGICGCGRCGCCARTDARRPSSPTARTSRR